MWCSKAVTLKGVPAAWSALLSTWRVYSPSQVANSPCSLSAECKCQFTAIQVPSCRLSQDAIRCTWFGVNFVIPLLKDQERVLVTMTSLKLDLQASESVRDGVVKDTHVYLQTGNQVPPALQCCPAFQRILVSGIVEAKLAASSPCYALVPCISQVPVALAHDRHCLLSQSVCFRLFCCIDNDFHPA